MLDSEVHSSAWSRQRWRAEAWGDALLQSWAQLKNLNVVANFQAATNSALLLQQGKYEAGLGATPNPATYPDTFYNALYTGVSTNVFHWSDPKLDKVLTDARPDVSIEQRAKSVKDITKYITDNVTYLMLYHAYLQTFVQKDVKGITLKDTQIQPVGMYIARG